RTRSLSRRPAALRWERFRTKASDGRLGSPAAVRLSSRARRRGRTELGPGPSDAALEARAPQRRMVALRARPRQTKWTARIRSRPRISAGHAAVTRKHLTK